MPYDIEIWHDPRKAPKGKLPVLRDGDALIADSFHIRQHLEKQHGCDFDGPLDQRQRAVADAFSKLCEEHLYWSVLHNRWWDEDNWKIVKAAYFSSIPALMRPLVVPAIRRATRAQIDGHGMGRHAPEEIDEFGMSDIRTLADFLDDKPYFMGDSATAVDATVYAFLSAIVECELPSTLKDEASKRANLVDYCARLRSEWFGVDLVARDETLTAEASAPQ